jgi:hypothetical protein
MKTFFPERKSSTSKKGRFEKASLFLIAQYWRMEISANPLFLKQEPYIILKPAPIMTTNKQKPNSAIEYIKNNKLLALTSATLLCLILALSTIIYYSYPILLETVIESKMPIQYSTSYQWEGSCEILEKYYNCDESRMENIYSILVEYWPTSRFAPFIGDFETASSKVNMLELCRMKLLNDIGATPKKCLRMCLGCQKLPDEMPCQNDMDCMNSLSWRLESEGSTWKCVSDDPNSPEGPKHCKLSPI